MSGQSDLRLPLNIECDRLHAEIQRVTGACSDDIEVWRETDPGRPEGLRWGARVEWPRSDGEITWTRARSPEAAMAKLLDAVTKGTRGEIVANGEARL